MSYYGENFGFSLRDNLCEEASGSQMSFADITSFFSQVDIKGNVAVGYSEKNLKSVAYSIAAGLSQHGNDVILLNNTLKNAFHFICSALNVPTAVLIQRQNPLVVSFFDSYGLPFNTDFLLHQTVQCGKIGCITSFDNTDSLYLTMLKNRISSDKFSASISCENQKVRNIWQNFFDDDSSSDICFQISHDGSTVNAYSQKTGFISHEKLIIAYAFHLMKSGISPILPDNVHFIANELADICKCKIRRYSDVCGAEIRRQLFTLEPLFLCTMLSEIGLISTCRQIPDFYTAKREISADNCKEQNFFTSKGRINATKSGKNRLTVTAQAYSIETAAELCSDYITAITKKCNTLHLKN